MKKLLKSLEKLKRSKIKKMVDCRIKEFERLGRRQSYEIFKELCFCILTANSTAERCIVVHQKVGNGFLTLSRKKLRQKLKKFGCRFHTRRADYIYDARKYRNSLKKIIQSFNDVKDLREWLVRNIKGFGMKEASHFLRNIGYKNVAIIDFHIIDILVENNLIKKPKMLSIKKYLETEIILKKIADKLKINLAKLDLYLWYLKTGKVLK